MVSGAAFEPEVPLMNSEVKFAAQIPVPTFI